CFTGLTVQDSGEDDHNDDVSPDGEGGRPPQGGNGEGRPGGQGQLDFEIAAETLEITVEELMDALGGPPPDFEAAAETLGITVEELMNAFDTP
ncbi:MAG: hypothetical protein AAFV93_24970, partial [Chloroflexota bacterium]